MDFSVTNGLSDQLASLRQARNARSASYSPAPPREETDAALPAIINRAPSNTNTPQGTRLVDETRADLGGGAYRLTHTFEREDGRSFTKVEEFALTQRGSRKTVIQQNPSGSITRYEEILDRESTGNFRRTQRFQDATGEVSTNITTGYKVSDPFILSGGASAYEEPSPFNPTRGTQLDLSA
jgi:hypothetical protein